MTGRGPRLALAVLALALLAACGGRAGRVESGLRRASSLLQASQWDKADIEARNVLQIDPKNARAKALVAAAAEARGDLSRAYAAWSDVAELAPADLEAPVALARLQLLAGDAEAADRALSELLHRKPGLVGALVLQAVSMARHGRTDEAIARLRDIADGPGPVPTDATVALAGLLVQRGETVEALQRVDAALAASPEDPSLVRAATHVADAAAQAPGDTSAAARAVDLHRRATRLAPQDLPAWSAWAAFHESRHEPTLAEAVLRASIAAQPRDEARPLLLADFLHRWRGAAAAEAVLLAAVDDHPRAPAPRLRLAELYEASGRPADARQVLAGLVALDPRAPAALDAQDRLAALAWAAGDPAAASRWLAATLRANPRDGQALVLHARLALAQGRAAEAVEDLRTAARDQPAAPGIVGLLARAHRAAGEPQLARDVLADAVKARPADPALRLLLAADMTDNGEPDNAARTLAETIRLAPRDARAYEARAMLATAGNDFDGAERTWQALLAALPCDAKATLALATLRQRRGDAGDALAVFDRQERACPAQPGIAAARAGWLARTGRVDDAIAAYERLHAGVPDDASVANDLAWLLAEHREDAEALARARALAEPFAACDDAQRLDTLGWIRYRSGQTPAAVAVLERAAALAPGVPQIRLHLGMALHASGQRERGDALLRQVLAGGAPLAHREAARRLVSAG